MPSSPAFTRSEPPGDYIGFTTRRLVDLCTSLLVDHTTIVMVYHSTSTIVGHHYGERPVSRHNSIVLALRPFGDLLLPVSFKFLPPISAADDLFHQRRAPL